MTQSKKLAAEAIGTFSLVFAGIGSAVLAAGVPNVGIGFMGVAFAVGLSVMAGAYAFGGISGGHFNPAVTVGLLAAGKFDSGKVVGYIIAQCVGGLMAAALFSTLIATSVNLGNVASNGYGSASMVKAGIVSVFLIEVLLTAFLVFVIIGSTSKRAVEQLNRAGAEAVVFSLKQAIEQSRELAFPASVAGEDETDKVLPMRGDSTIASTAIAG